jgi:DNA-binding transcriptional regulator YhcF (GntR family)
MKEKLLKHITAKGIDSKTLATKAGVNYNTVRRLLPIMAREGLIEWTWA